MLFPPLKSTVDKEQGRLHPSGTGSWGTIWAAAPNIIFRGGCNNVLLPFKTDDYGNTLQSVLYFFP